MTAARDNSYSILKKSVFFKKNRPNLEGRFFKNGFVSLQSFFLC